MTAKVENYCMRKISNSISVDRDERCCMNCIWYEQHFRMGRGNVVQYIPISSGACLLDGERRGALDEPCGHFEREEKR